MDKNKGEESTTGYGGRRNHGENLTAELFARQVTGNRRAHRH